MEVVGTPEEPQGSESLLSLLLLSSLVPELGRELQDVALGPAGQQGEADESRSSAIPNRPLDTRGLVPARRNDASAILAERCERPVSMYVTRRKSVSLSIKSGGWWCSSHVLSTTDEYHRAAYERGRSPVASRPFRTTKWAIVWSRRPNQISLRAFVRRESAWAFIAMFSSAIIQSCGRNEDVIWRLQVEDNVDTSMTNVFTVHKPENWRDIVVDPDGAMIAVGTGAMARSTDSGKNWASVGAGTNSLFMTTVVESGDTMIAAGLLGTILRSTDDGKSWTAVSSGVNNSLWSTAVGPDGTALVVGGHGVILRSVDDGKSWTSVSSGTKHDLRSSVVARSGAAIAVGDHGTIVRSTDQGQT